MKRTLLKILLGIGAFILGSLITALIFIPTLSLLTQNEIILNVLHLIFTIVLTVIIYQLIATKVLD